MWKLDKGLIQTVVVRRGEAKRLWASYDLMCTLIPKIPKITGHPEITKPCQVSHVCFGTKVWSCSQEMRSHTIWDNNILIYSMWREMHVFHCQRVPRKPCGGFSLASIDLKTMNLLWFQTISHCCPSTTTISLCCQYSLCIWLTWNKNHIKSRNVETGRIGVNVVTWLATLERGLMTCLTLINLNNESLV